MAKTSIYLKVALGLLMVVSAIELALVSATVAYLHRTGGEGYTYPAISNDGQTIQVPGLPTNLLVDQGHTSNGAAGTAFVVIGLCGMLALWLRGRAALYHDERSLGGRLARAWYRLWLALQVPALLLTLGALAYVLAVTTRHAGQAIDLTATPTTTTTTYPLLAWTPQNWFDALLRLDLAAAADRDGLATIRRVARGWEYNLVPLLVVQLAETVLALHGARARREEERRLAQGHYQGVEAGDQQHEDQHHYPHRYARPGVFK